MCISVPATFRFLSSTTSTWIWMESYITAPILMMEMYSFVSPRSKSSWMFITTLTRCFAWFSHESCSSWRSTEWHLELKWISNVADGELFYLKFRSFHINKPFHHFSFRAAKDAEHQIELAKKKGEKLPDSDRFDSNCITPGTAFMVRLQDGLKQFVKVKISTNPLWRKCKIILSGHEVCNG